MSSFNIRTYPTSPIRGTRIQKKATADILMGALVEAGTVADTVIATNSGTLNAPGRPIGVAVMDEVMARKNENSSNVAQEKYTADDPVVVETLVNGDVLNLMIAATTDAQSAFGAGSLVEFGVDGLVYESKTVTPGTVNPIGVALDAPGLTANQQSKYVVPVLIQVTGPHRIGV